MAQRAQLVSNLLLVFAFSFFACKNSGAPDAVRLSQNSENANLRNVNGIIFFNNQPYSGLLYTLYPNAKDTAEIKSFLNGKEDGEWIKYYPSGLLKEKRSFKNGLKEGEYAAWWQNGKKQLLFHFINDQYEGVCSQWNEGGTLIQQMTYVKGYEEGPQKMYYDNGKIRSNYVIKNGRRFGLLGTKNCINVSDSVFKK